MFLIMCHTRKFHLRDNFLKQFLCHYQDSFLPPHQRTSYDCEKSPTGPLDRKKLIEHINKQALETPDIPDLEPFVAGVVRGKKWIPPPQEARMQAAEEQIAIDLGDEYEQALTDATQEEIIDLAAILGFHQMVNVIAINCRTQQQFTRPFIKMCTSIN